MQHRLSSLEKASAPHFHSPSSTLARCDDYNPRSGLTVAPTKDMSTSKSLGPVNVTLLGKRYLENKIILWILR